MINILIMAVIIGLTHLISLSLIMSFKYHLKKHLLLYTLALIIFTAISALGMVIFEDKYELSVGIPFVVNITLTFILFMLTAYGSKLKKIFLFINYANIFCVITCLSIMFTQGLLKNLNLSLQNYVKSFLILIVTVFLSFLYRKCLKEKMDLLNDLDKPSWYSICLISFVFLIAYAAFTITCKNNFQEIHYAISFTGITLIYIVSFGLVLRIIYYMRNENNMHLVKLNLEYVQKQLELARETENQAKRIRHDAHHHNQNLELLLKDGKVDEALEYIKDYNNSLDSYIRQNFCVNVTCNAVLNNYYFKTQGKNIKYEVTADLPEVLGVKNIDLVAILSNVLENAFNATESCDKNKYIKINLKLLDNKLIILCTNPTSSVVELENGMVKNKGIGLESIISTVKKYYGDISYEVKEDSITVCIILKVKLKN